jgi:predicted transcriptional regulator
MEVTVRLPDGVGHALSDLADRTGRSPDELIAEALLDYLDQTATATPISFGIYADPELSGAEADDWLRENWRPR